ncbi:SpoIIE family protein phosphatase [Streptomyces sp. NPDC006450]|uniref:SpoIIE family protein phosphatase n=1 Tax=Streptomyces sp. NPDC006450 TaxID=3155458 RepID=UPI0033A42522
MKINTADRSRSASAGSRLRSSGPELGARRRDTAPRQVVQAEDYGPCAQRLDPRAALRPASRQNRDPHRPAHPSPLPEHRCLRQTRPSPPPLHACASPWAGALTPRAPGRRTDPPHRRTRNLPGVMETPALHVTETEPQPGDLLLMYTDGVTDRRAGTTMLGERGLQR